MTNVASLDSIPIAALLARGDVIVAANPAYEKLMSIRADQVVGRTVSDLIAQFVHTPDNAVVESAADALKAGQLADGTLWIRVIDARGVPRSLRVIWETADADGGVVIYLLEAANEAAAKSLAEALARAGGDLVRCRDEAEVLERAADALFAQGLTVTTFLLRGDDPFLAYGPTRTPDSPTAKPSPLLVSIMKISLPRGLLTRVNPHFYERRAAFFQEVAPLVDSAYPSEVATSVKFRLPAKHGVQAPIFVDEAPYGALVVTSNALSPALAGAIEMFAELVARAIENVRLIGRAAARLEELQCLQSELVVRERLAALGEAAAVMAHEVRNPIGAIANAATLLRRNSGLDLELLRVIDEEAARLERMVSDLLDLGRPLAPKLRAVDLCALAKASVDVTRQRRECEDIAFTVEEAGSNLLASVDPDLVQLAVLNVMRNAAQATPPGGRVIIRVEPKDAGVAIVIDDEGPGFPALGTDRLFEPFFTTRAAGTGIGLAVVRRVVEANEGRLEIGATERGGGRFKMIFGRADPEESIG